MKASQVKDIGSSADVKSLSGAERVLATLTVLGSYPEGIGLNELARALNAPRSSVHRAFVSNPRVTNSLSGPRSGATASNRIKSTSSAPEIAAAMPSYVTRDFGALFTLHNVASGPSSSSESNVARALRYPRTAELDGAWISVLC